MKRGDPALATAGVSLGGLRSRIARPLADRCRSSIPPRRCPASRWSPGWQVAVHPHAAVAWPIIGRAGFGVPAVADGAAAHAISRRCCRSLTHSLDTIVRLSTGLALGGVVGLALGLAVSWSRWTRRLVDLPVQFLPHAAAARHGAAVPALVRHLFRRQGPVRRLWRRRHRLRRHGQCGAQRAADLHRQRPLARARRDCGSIAP